jgi:methylated-DNA-[protein]-cysteine S-methyltransferase
MEAVWSAEGRLRRLNLAPEARPVGSDLSPLARRVQAHFEGQSQDFRDVPLATEGLTPFASRVYRAAQDVPSGSVTSYGQLALALGSPGSTRAVGTALGKNPFLLVVPCHRVLAAGHGLGGLSTPGALGGFSAPGGLATKSLMLAAEGFGVESLWQAGQMDQGRALLGADRRLGPVVWAVGPCPLSPLYPDHPFAALARNVVYQQLAGSAARAIELRVSALGSPPFPGPEELLALEESALRGAGLSGPKVQTLRALARAVLDGELRVEELRLLPDDRVVAEVSKVKGLGSWSAEMFLLFHLGRRDLLPVKDLGIRKGFQRLFGGDSARAGARAAGDLPEPPQMERWARPWRPFRSLASWYLWSSLEL